MSQTAEAEPAAAPPGVVRRRSPLAVGLAAAALALVIVGFVASVGAFPESWNFGLADPIDRTRRWLINNQTSTGCTRCC